jgi:hypothetical protein
VWGEREHSAVERQTLLPPAKNNQNMSKQETTYTHIDKRTIADVLFRA